MRKESAMLHVKQDDISQQLTLETANLIASLESFANLLQKIAPQTVGKRVRKYRSDGFNRDSREGMTPL